MVSNTARVDLLRTLRQQWQREHYAIFEARSLAPLPLYWRSTMLHTCANSELEKLATAQVREQVAWLWCWYTCRSLRRGLSYILGKWVEPRASDEALYIKLLREGLETAWRCDVGPYRLMLYASHTSERIGGGLGLTVRTPEPAIVYPRAGQCVLIEADQPYTITALSKEYRGPFVWCSMQFCPLE